MYRVLINQGHGDWSMSEPMELGNILAYITSMGASDYMVVKECKVNLTLGEVG